MSEDKCACGYKPPRRCPCGARIVSVKSVEKTSGGLEIYECGVCGTELEIREWINESR